MLNTQQSEYINERMYSSDHDYFFWSSLHGEPFLENDILHYYDGEKVTIVGFLLDPGLDCSAALSRLTSLALKWLGVPSVRFFYYVGPWLWDLDSISKDNFSLIFSLEPQLYNVDMFVDLSSSFVLQTRNAKESIRKVVHRGLDVQINPRSCLGYEHINLIRRLVSQHDMWLSDVCYLTNVVTILASKTATFFEVWVDQKLVGFAVAHDFYERKPFLILACFDDAYTGASDAIYAKIIKYYMERGAKWLGLGGSIYEGLYRYKMKWGGVRCNMPFYQSIWMKHETDCKSVDCLHWVCRLLLSKSHGLC